MGGGYAHAEKLGELKYVSNGITIHLTFERQHTYIAIDNQSRHKLRISPGNLKIVTKTGVLQEVCGFSEQQTMGHAMLMTPLVVARGERTLATFSYCGVSNVIADRIKIKSIRIGKMHVYPSSATRLIGGRVDNPMFY